MALNSKTHTRSAGTRQLRGQVGQIQWYVGSMVRLAWLLVLIASPSVGGCYVEERRGPVYVEPDKHERHEERKEEKREERREKHDEKHEDH